MFKTPQEGNDMDNIYLVESYSRDGTHGDPDYFVHASLSEALADARVRIGVKRIQPARRWDGDFSQGAEQRVHEGRAWTPVMGIHELPPSAPNSEGCGGVVIYKSPALTDPEAVRKALRATGSYLSDLGRCGDGGPCAVCSTCMDNAPSGPCDVCDSGEPIIEQDATTEEGKVLSLCWACAPDATTGATIEEGPYAGQVWA